MDVSFGRAFYYFKLAADQGHPQAEYAVSSCYYKGEGVSKSNETGFYYCKLAAVQNIPEALRTVRCCYFDGDGIEKSLERGVIYFKRAADLGYAPSQCSLGTCLQAWMGLR